MKTAPVDLSSSLSLGDSGLLISKASVGDAVREMRTDRSVATYASVVSRISAMTQSLKFPLEEVSVSKCCRSEIWNSAFSGSARGDIG